MRCPICRAETEPRQLPYRNTLQHASATFADMTVLSCTVCDSSWVENPPSDAALGQYYASDYTPAQMGGVKAERWPIWDDRPASLIMLGRMFAEFKPSDLFVDIGPGNGASLSIAPYMLPQPRLACVEFNQASIALFRKKVPGIVVAQSLDEIVGSQGPESVKFLYSAHSFEHFAVEALVAQLSAVHGALTQDGVAVIEVPFAPFRKITRVPSHAPHLIFFSQLGLTRMLEEAGFTVRLLLNTYGRTKSGSDYVEAALTKPDGSIDPAFRRRVAVWNAPDLIARRGGPVLKAVATKAPA